MRRQGLWMSSPVLPGHLGRSHRVSPHGPSLPKLQAACFLSQWGPFPWTRSPELGSQPQTPTLEGHIYPDGWLSTSRYNLLFWCHRWQLTQRCADPAWHFSRDTQLVQAGTSCGRCWVFLLKLFQRLAWFTLTCNIKTCQETLQLQIISISPLILSL